MPIEQTVGRNKSYEDLVADPEKALHQIVEWWLTGSDTNHLRVWLENRIPCASKNAVSTENSRKQGTHLALFSI